MRGALYPSPGAENPPSGMSILISKEKAGHPRQKTSTNSRDAHVKRQRKKYLSQMIVTKLLPFEDSRMQNQYRRAMDCGSVIEQVDGRLTTRYCKTRCCLVCNGIRSAMLIDTYKPIVETWPDPRMVTLTVPNVPLSKLRDTVDEMARQFALILKQLRRRGMDVRAVRVIEVTAKSVSDTHPHFHAAVPSGAVGDAIVESWLHRYPKASAKAQDVLSWDTDLRELFKYVTKMTSADMSPKLLDGILQAMWGKHLVRPYGFRLERDPTDDSVFDELVPVNVEWKRYGEHVVWIWHDALANWMDPVTGELLVDTDQPSGLSGFA